MNALSDSPRVGVDEFEDVAGWFRRHRGLVSSVVKRLGVPVDAVDDVVQETFVTAYQRRASFSGGSMRAWLVEVARRLASNHRRSASRRALAYARATEEMPIPDFPKPDAAAAVRELERFIATLSPSEREVFMLSEVAGLTGPEVAEATSALLSTTYSRIRCVRLRFASACSDRNDQASRRPATLRDGSRGWIALWTVITRPLTLMPTFAKIASVVAAATALLAIPAGFDAPAAASLPAVAGGLPPSLGDSVPVPVVAVAPPPPTPIAVPPAIMPVVGAPAPSFDSPHAIRRRPAKPTSAAESSRALEDATRDLRAGDPATALSRLEEHADHFPNSPMADVREALRLEALAGLGRFAEAGQAAARFLLQHPTSPLSQRVRRIAGGAN